MYIQGEKEYVHIFFIKQILMLWDKLYIYNIYYKNTGIHLHLPNIIFSISYGNLELIHSSIKTARLKPTRPIYRLVEIYSG